MKKIKDSIRLSVLAEYLNGRLAGEDVEITDVSGIDDVQAGEAAWAEGRKTLSRAVQSPAAALIISEETYRKAGEEISIPCLLVKKPRLAFARALGFFYERALPTPGIADTAQIGEGVVMGQNVSIGHYAVVGDNCRLGDGVVIFPHAYVGNNVHIGDNTLIYPFATIHNRCVLGRNVILHSGSVLGADGFGFVEEERFREKIPQVGIVKLGDNVEIGANVTIDRATTGVTSVGKGTKIDNLVQIGHNNHLGENCILVSQSGVAGSCEIGDNVTLAAQSGIAPHVKIGSNTVIGGRGGVTHDIPGNSIVSGFPAKPHREALRLNGYIQRLPLLAQTVKDMEKKIQELEEKLGKLSCMEKKA